MVKGTRFAKLTVMEKAPETNRIFLLSPANCGGKRAGWIFREGATFYMAQQLQSGGAVPLDEIFTYLSGLYFRGKQTYARRFASPPAGTEGVWVITPSRGLRELCAPVTLDELIEYAEVDIDINEARYTEPLEYDATRLAKTCGENCEVILLGSIASGKYVDILLRAFGDHLKFPIDFVGRGDMSRGGLLLRCAESGTELPYESVGDAVRRGPRPPKLEKKE